MPIDSNYYIQTGKDGSLERDGRDTSADIDALVNDLAGAKHVALIIHGGLITGPEAIATGEALRPLLEGAGIRPVFPVWETGMWTSVQNLVQDVSKEKLFESLVKMLLKHVAGKLMADLPEGGRDFRGLPNLPTGVQTQKEWLKRQAEEEPFGQVEPPDDLEEVTKAEREEFEKELKKNKDFNAGAEEAARSIEDQRGQATGARSALASALPPGAVKPTLVNPELFGAPPPEGGRWGLIETAKLVWTAGKVFVRVISRFRQGRDHGIYASVVEEVLREFYGAAIGAAVWGTMKRQASETFNSPTGAPPRGGWYFVQKLGELLARKPELQVSVVGHSAGAIYACHLMQHVKSALPGFRFKNVVFLAPACSHDLFAEVLKANPLPFERFRQFALDDVRESGYWEVSYVYPRSLLYFVSGAFELEAPDKGAYDLPLVGMERYHTGEKVYDSASVKRVREFLNGDGGRVHWSSGPGEGVLVDSLRHGAFFLVGEGANQKPTLVMNSVCDFLTSA